MSIKKIILYIFFIYLFSGGSLLAQVDFQATDEITDVTDITQIESRLVQIDNELSRIQEEAQTAELINTKLVEIQKSLTRVTQAAAKAAKIGALALRECNKLKSLFLKETVRGGNDTAGLKLAGSKFTLCIQKASQSVNLGIRVQIQSTKWLEQSIQTLNRSKVFKALVEANISLTDALFAEKEALNILKEEKSILEGIENFNLKIDENAANQLEQRKSSLENLNKEIE